MRRNNFQNLSSNLRNVIMIACISPIIWFSSPKSVEAGPFQLPDVPIMDVKTRYKPSHQRLKGKVEEIITPKTNRLGAKLDSEILTWIHLSDPKFLKSTKTLTCVRLLRGGGIGNIIFGIVTFYFLWSSGALAFILNHQNPAWGIHPDNLSPPQPMVGETQNPQHYISPSSKPRNRETSVKMSRNRPSSLPHEEFVALKPEARRALPHKNDRTITYKNYEPVTVRFGQAKYKVRGHGGIHGVKYIVNDKGGTQSNRTDENALTMIDGIEGLTSKENFEWIEDGRHLDNTTRSYDAVFLYDHESHILAVFKKSTREFVTTVQLDEKEHTELIYKRNFGGEKKRSGGQARNLPPKQTNINTFQNDIKQISPINSMNEEQSPGFTPLNSFESDVKGITPIDPGNKP